MSVLEYHRLLLEVRLEGVVLLENSKTMKMDFGMAILLLLALCCTLMPTVYGFGSGVNITMAPFQQLYCNRPANSRMPIHISEECRGPCRAQRGPPAYTISVTEREYWDSPIRGIVYSRHI